MRRCLIWLHAKTVWKPRIIFGTVLLSVFTGWNGAHSAASYAILPIVTIWDSLFIALAGPGRENFSLLTFLPWFVIHIWFCFLMNYLLSGEHHLLGFDNVHRLGSRQKWGLIISLSLWLNVIFYVILVTLFAGIGGFLWQLASSVPPLHLTDTWITVDTYFQLLTLTTVTLLIMSTLQFLLSLALKKVIYGFITSVVMYSIAWLIDHPIVEMLLPTTQSMMFRHAPLDNKNPAFTFEWSLVYSFCLWIVFTLVTRFYIGRMDFIRET